MKRVRLIFATAVAIAAAEQARAAVSGGAVSQGVMGLVEFGLAILAVAAVGFVIKWGLELSRGFQAIGLIVIGAIGLLIALNPEDILGAAGIGR